MPALWASLTLFCATALAQPDGTAAKGVLVRLEPSGHPVTDTPSVVLAPTSGGESITVELNDDGQPPDVAAADGRWAGVAMTPDPEFAVTLSLGEKTLDGGTVSWTDDSNARDLVLTLTGDGVVAQATAPDGGLAQGGAPDVAPASGSPAPSGSPVGAASIPPADAGTSGPAPLGGAGGVGNSTAADDGWLWVALGVGAMCLVGGLLLVLRGGPPARTSISLERAPEPPVFGPGTPALSRGLTVWRTEPGEQDRFVAGLVGALARDHRVLLILSSQSAVPNVFGGPVYVSRETDPKRIEDHLADIEEQPGLPLVVVVVTDRPDSAFITALTEMMDPDPGAILVAADPPGERTPDITVMVDGATAHLTTSRGNVQLTETSRGYIAEAS